VTTPDAPFGALLRSLCSLVAVGVAGVLTALIWAAAGRTEDRELTLKGYEVYLKDHAAAVGMLSEFFTRLLHRHGHHIP
jgi:hypothetical protein